MRFDAEKQCERCAEWIKDFFEKNGPGCNAVVGISGGKDSSVVAALCVKALGAERVIGVIMPNGVQDDIDMAYLLVNHLGIRHYEINIREAVKAIEGEMPFVLSSQSRINLPPRIRMSVLYAVSQSNNGRVANTCNLSEDWVGYSTRFGDGAGDFSPVSSFTVTEVKMLGRALGLPEALVEKVPTDGLSGMSDEEKLGFSYAELDAFIRDGVSPGAEKEREIRRLNRLNAFKLEAMPKYMYDGKSDE